MKIIVDKKDTKVLYDEKKFEYIKLFHLNIWNRIGCFFKIKKYPGINFNDISLKLNKLGIKTVKIKTYDKYKVVTEELIGSESLENFKDNKVIMKKYYHIIKTLYDNKIYSGDLALDNFLVKNNEIYALDLEGYKTMNLTKRSPKEFERRFRKLMAHYNIEI